jgi:glutaredoxin 3
MPTLQTKQQRKLNNSKHKARRRISNRLKPRKMAKHNKPASNRKQSRKQSSRQSSKQSSKHKHDRSQIKIGSVAELDQLRQSNAVVIFATTTCPYCRSVKDLFASKLNVHPKRCTFYYLDALANDLRQKTADSLYAMTHQQTVPNVFVFGKHIGGYTDCLDAMQAGMFDML